MDGKSYEFIPTPKLQSQVDSYRERCLKQTENLTKLEDVCNIDGTVIRSHPLIQLFLFGKSTPDQWNFTYHETHITAKRYSQILELHWNGIWKIPQT